MKTKTTIITLAALSLGIAATQAGRGNELIVPGAAGGSQTQNASHAVHTFDLGDVWAYKITGYSYTLTTMDSSSSRNTWINVTSNGYTGEVFKIQIPLERKVETTGCQPDDFVPKILSGDDLNLVYSWQHGASAYGSIALAAVPIPSAPIVTGDMDVVSVATAESKPVVGWSCQISFTDDE